MIVSATEQSGIFPLENAEGFFRDDLMFIGGRVEIVPEQKGRWGLIHWREQPPVSDV